jgi:hypothetical protein
MSWQVDRDSFFVGGAVMCFAITLMGFIFPFPSQISFLLPIIFTGVIIIGLIVINLLEGRENGTR